MNASRRSCLAPLLVLSFACLVASCSRGYVTPDELARHRRGPEGCQSTCNALGMRMGALVLISDTTPACVCEPLPTSGAPSATTEGAAGAAGGEFALAAAQAGAAVAAHQRLQQQQTRTTTAR